MQDNNDIDKSLIEKVQKLMSLATSPNQHEAEIAARKAQELIAKYNIDMQLLNSKQEYQWQVLMEEPYFRVHQKFVWPILREYYFVETLLSYVPTGERTAAGQQKTKVQLKIMGTATNVIIADYVFGLLCEVFQKLFLDFKRANNLDEKSRQPYYQGLSEGIKHNLDLARSQAQKDMAAKVQIERNLSIADATALTVVKRDPVLRAAFEASGKYKSHKSAGWNGDEDARQAGFNEGKNINLSRPIDHRGDAPILGIGYKKK